MVVERKGLPPCKLCWKVEGDAAHVLQQDRVSRATAYVRRHSSAPAILLHTRPRRFVRARLPPSAVEKEGLFGDVACQVVRANANTSHLVKKQQSRVVDPLFDLLVPQHIRLRDDHVDRRRRVGHHRQNPVEDLPYKHGVAILFRTHQ